MVFGVVLDPSWTHLPTEGNLETVAGGRNILKIPQIPFSFEIIRPIAA